MSSCHLPPAEIATRVRTREHGASQAREEQPISAFPWSLAEEGGLHAWNQTPVPCISRAWLWGMQGTKQDQEIRIGVAHFLAKHAYKVL